MKQNENEKKYKEKQREVKMKINILFNSFPLHNIKSVYDSHCWMMRCWFYLPPPPSPSFITKTEDVENKKNFKWNDNDNFLSSHFLIFQQFLGRHTYVHFGFLHCRGDKVIDIMKKYVNLLFNLKCYQHISVGAYVWVSF